MQWGTTEHWDTVYATKPFDETSWFQAWPEPSLRLLSSVAQPRSAVIDVGGGASTLVDALLDQGWSDITILDVSTKALAVVRTRLRERQHLVSVIAADVLSWQPNRRYEAWHDRAVFHFLTEARERQRYVAAAAGAVAPGGAAIIGVFAADGPTHCSGLPTTRYTAEDLGATFTPAFQLIHSEREEHTTPSGTTQPFTWVVLRRT